MTRTDFLSLSDSDLAALTNRGTVKRAQREIDSGELRCEIHESEGALMVTWSDGTVCRFPAGATIHDASCSSGSVGISRHVIRSVLAYRQQKAGSEPDADESHAEPSSVAGTAWDPGDIGDDALIKQFRKAAITRARKVFEQGVLVELTRGAKPSARFLHESCTVRFPVPGDIRYARADCAEALLPQWVPMAVWAFREFRADRVAGLLSIQQAELPTPHEELDRLGDLLAELCADGIAGVAATWPQRLARSEKQLRSSGLVWPAELVVDLLHQHQRYREQDARFSPQEIVRLTGELIARSRAIRTQNGSVPQALVRGNKSDRRTDIKGGRFVGLGLGVRLGRRHTTMQAFFQDTDTGTVVAAERVFSDPDPDGADDPKSFTDLAMHGLHRGVSLGAASLSQMLLGSGKRTPTDELILPRGAGKLMTNPQTFQWEQLAPPLAVEDFAQLRQRFESLPPDWLRPRRQTENLHVLSIAGVAETEFDVVNQQLTATIHDSVGDTARLIHPYHRRGDQGFAELMMALQHHGSQVRFVCGHVRFINQQLQIHPISVVLQNLDGSRIALSAWLGGGDTIAAAKGLEVEQQARRTSPIAEFFQQLQDCLAEALLTGLNQASATDWNDLSRSAQRLGFVRLAGPIEVLAKDLSERSNQLRWNAAISVQTTAQLCMLSRMLE